MTEPRPPEPALVRRILVIGSREWTDDRAIFEALAPYRYVQPPPVLVHGDSHGAAKIAAAIWRYWGLPTEAHSPRWDLYGRHAGFVRSREMIDTRADVCLEFNVDSSPGTTREASRARNLGIPVVSDTRDTGARARHQEATERKPRRTTNDMDLIKDVIRAASNPGYALAARGYDVYRRDGPHELMPCPAYEADAVHQLIDRKWLTVETRIKPFGRPPVDVYEITVPRRTRGVARRWSSFAPLPT